MGKFKNNVWYPQDSAAKLFAAVSDERSTNVFRLSAMLKEEVRAELLQQACDRTLKMFPLFRTRLKRGFFWYYLERNPEPLKVEKESAYPCAFIPYYKPPRYLLRISYFGRRINAEMSHALTDGGAWVFMCCLVCQYLKLQYPQELKDAKLPKDTYIPLREQVENSYFKYYTKFGLNSPFRKKAYRIKGERLPAGVLQVIHGVCSTKEFIKLSKSYHATVTEFLAAAVIHCIHQVNTDGLDKKRAITINLPVNLRNYFPSRTLRNFFACIEVDHTYKTEAPFEQVLVFVQEQIAQRLTKEKLGGLINYTASAEKNITMFTPLAIKNIYLRGAHARAESAFSTAVSNIGRITLPEEFRPYVENMDGILAPSRYHPIKFSVSSFFDKMTISFTSNIRTDIAKCFYSFLSEQGLSMIMCNNGVEI